MKRLSLSLALAALYLSACQTTLPEGQRFGEPLVVQRSVPFAVVDASPADYFDRTVLVEATVKAVCVSKGCWMQVEDEGQTAMVRWESGCGGKYAFPQELVGKRVLVQGSFYPKVISEEDAEHLEAEAGEGLEIEREGYEFNASGVLLLGS